MPPRERLAVSGPDAGHGGTELRDFLTRIDQPFDWVDAARSIRTSTSV